MLATRQLYKNGTGAEAGVPKVGAALATTEHSLFKIDKHNRPVREPRVALLCAAIAKKNLLAEYPIVVDADLNVIDGQHRLEAAKRLEVPIYYIVSRMASIEDIAETNNNTSRWSHDDYLHFYCTTGNVEYLKLREFHETYPFMTLSSAASLCHYGDSTGRDATGRLATGKYTANDIPFAVKVANACLDFSAYVKFYGTGTFISSLANLMSNDLYNHERMMGKMEYNSARLVRCANVDMYISVINEIYNWKARGDAVVFLKKLNPRSNLYRTDRK